jgi:CSLREA domain-containing protein
MGALLLAFGWMKPARAANITVDTLLDENDGSCSDGDCSLRDAIQLANADDTIDFSVTGVTTLELGDIPLDKSLTILGPGNNNLTISGDNNSRIFYIYDSIPVTISDVTIADGYADDGGGIYNLGSLTLLHSIISNNSSTDDGGGIYNGTGTLYVEQSAFISNTAEYGGGIKNQDATATLINSTFYSNYADRRGSAMDSGGIQDGSNVTINNCSFYSNAGNSAVGNPNSNTLVTNTIIADIGDQSCNGEFTVDSNHNLATDDTCTPGFSQATIDSLKLILQDWVVELEYGSKAIDTGNNAVCPAIDQLGNPRPMDGNGDNIAVCDVGSYEAPTIVLPYWIRLPIVSK